MPSGTHPQAGETLEESGSERDAVLPVRPYLFLVIEADRPAAGGARYSLAGVEEVVLGRGDERSMRRTQKAAGDRLTIASPDGGCPPPTRRSRASATRS